MNNPHKFCRLVDSDSEVQIGIIRLFPGINLNAESLMIKVNGLFYSVNHTVLEINDEGSIIDQYAEVSLC